MGNSDKWKRVGAGVATGGLSEVFYYQPKRAAEKFAAAAEAAAMAQKSAADKNYANVRDITDKATVAGLANMDRDLANIDRDISRQEQLVAAMDPAVIEASQQALKLMRGEKSATLKPMQQQRDQQRQKLVNSLREQLGPGAETSTAGIQALTRFDAETNNLLNTAQQDAIQRLGGTAQQFTSTRPDLMKTFMGRNAVGQNRAGLQFTQANMLNSAAAPGINAAGAQFVGDQMRAQQQQQFWQQMGGLAMTGIGYAVGGPAGGMIGGQMGNQYAGGGGMAAMGPGASPSGGSFNYGGSSMVPSSYNSSYLGTIGGP